MIVRERFASELSDFGFEDNDALLERADSLME
jgi:hypothetical protein